MNTTLQITVTGMKCGGCEKTITEKLTALEGLISVLVNYKEDWVEVVFDDSKTEEEAILECIEDAGFTVVD